MKLRDLNPRLVDVTPEGVTKAGTQAVFFDCPCRSGHRLLISFDRAIGGGPAAVGHAWARTGETLDDLTLSPSLLVRGGPDGAECWHGWIREGQVVTC